MKLMTLQELYDKEYPNTEWIGVYEGPEVNIVPDNADFYLKELGDCKVMNYAYNEEDDVLIVDLGMRSRTGLTMEHIKYYANYAVKDLCQRMHTLYNNHACENCSLLNIDDNKCIFNIMPPKDWPKDWELDEKDNLNEN